MSYWGHHLHHHQDLLWHHSTGARENLTTQIKNKKYINWKTLVIISIHTGKFWSTNGAGRSGLVTTLATSGPWNRDEQYTERASTADGLLCHYTEVLKQSSTENLPLAACCLQLTRPQKCYKLSKALKSLNFPWLFSGAQRRVNKF